MPIDPQKLKADGLNPPVKRDINLELEEQRQILLQIYENTRKTRRYIVIGRVISLVYLLIILGFFAVGLKVISPLINKVNDIMMPYNSLLGNEELQDVDVGKINDLLIFGRTKLGLKKPQKKRRS